MKKTFKSILSVAFCFMMLTGTIFAGGYRFADVLDAINIKTSADGETYAVGDIIEYGTYPQSKVTDEDIIAALNALAGDSSAWMSCGYYSGDGSGIDGNMSASDYMRYKDVLLDGVKYRAVIFDTYRPYYTGYESTSSTTYQYQQENGYTCGNIYWFKYEPIRWRVLDPATGLVMCDAIIDSQAYNNYLLKSGADAYDFYAYWGDSEKTYYGCNYEKSSIRQWLNNDFCNIAFSDEQKANIRAAAIDNSACESTYSLYGSVTTTDKVYLLSYSDVINSSYGFSKSYNSFDTARRLKGSDYAKAQGLRVYSDTDGSSCWRLRTAGSSSDDSCYVRKNGSLTGDGFCYTYFTYTGIVPAMNLYILKSDIAGSEIDNIRNIAISVPEGKTIGWKFKAKMTASADLPSGYHLAWYEGSKLVCNDAVYTTESLTSQHTYTAKIVDGNGNIASPDAQNKSVTVSVKTGFFDRIISFFQRLFGSDVTAL